MTKEKIWKHTHTIYIIAATIIALATFFVGHYTQPLAFKIDVNAKKLIEIEKFLNERPTKSELKPELENIKKDISEIKDTQKEIYRLLLEIYTKPG